jgi:precorrin-2 dehydrogenase/sirohydrochlorin ferrochelatase
MSVIMKLYPVNLKLKDQLCLIVGGGKIAHEKIQNLLASQAAVDVVSPQLFPEMELLWSRNKFRWISREFIPTDISDLYGLIIACTNNPKVNQEIYDLSMQSGKLINCVDEPQRCNFYVPSIVQCGDLQISISTTGKAPLLSKSIRQRLENVFNESILTQLETIYHLREEIVEEKSNKSQRIEMELKPEINLFIEQLNWG